MALIIPAVHQVIDDAAAPVFDPPQDFYSGSLNVTLETVTDDAHVVFTLQVPALLHSEPTLSSLLPPLCGALPGCLLRPDWPPLRPLTSALVCAAAASVRVRQERHVVPAHGKTLPFVLSFSTAFLL